MDLSGVLAGAGVLLGAAAHRFMSSKTEKQLTTSSGENGETTIRKLVERIDTRTERMDGRLYNVEERVQKIEEWLPPPARRVDDPPVVAVAAAEKR